MKPEFILKADVLDILFENRNKSYGAYELRKHYDRRLRKAIGAVLLLMAVSVALYEAGNRFFAVNRQVVPFVVTDTVMLDPFKVMQVKPPVEPQAVPKRSTTIKDVTFHIVGDAAMDTTSAPTQDDKETKNTGSQNIVGDDSGDDHPNQPAANPGTGKETPQNTPESSTVLGRSEIMPEFPGGFAALQRFLIRNLRTPGGEMATGSKIRVMVRFVVNAEGTVTDIEIEQSGGGLFDNEVSRVLKKMPAWKPGRQNGQNVAVYFEMPVLFQGPDEN
jgi:periplasmic protein TonB